MTIGDRIKQRRMELGMSQEELAHKLGYKSRSSVNKIELGGQNLTQKKIKKIADALDTTPEYIMGWDEQVKFHATYTETFINKGTKKRGPIDNSTDPFLIFYTSYTMAGTYYRTCHSLWF